MLRFKYVFLGHGSFRASPSFQWWEFSEILLHLHYLSPTRIHSTALKAIYMLFYWVKMCRIILWLKRESQRRWLNDDYRMECICYKTWQKTECWEVRGCGRQWLCKMNVPFIANNHLRSLGLKTQKIKE